MTLHGLMKHCRSTRAATDAGSILGFFLFIASTYYTQYADPAQLHGGGDAYRYIFLLGFAGALDGGFGQ